MCIRDRHSTRAAKIQAGVFNQLDAAGVRYEPFLTKYPDTEANIDDMRNTFQDGDIILSAGGDGTAMQISNAVLREGHTNTPVSYTHLDVYKRQIYIPTAGELLIDGKPYSVGGGVKLGYLPEERGLYKKESVIDTMVYFGQLKGLSRDEARQQSLAFLERVKLGDKAKTRLDKLLSLIHI